MSLPKIRSDNELREFRTVSAWPADETTKARVPSGEKAMPCGLMYRRRRRKGDPAER